MRTLTFLFLLAVMVYSCSKKTAPVKSNPEPVVVTPPPADTLKMVAATEPAPDAMVTSGKGLYDAKCGRCHDFKRPELFTADRWTKIMDRMAPKARLTDDEKKDVVAYVHYYAKK